MPDAIQHASMGQLICLIFVVALVVEGIVLAARRRK